MEKSRLTLGMKTLWVSCGFLVMALGSACGTSQSESSTSAQKSDTTKRLDALRGANGKCGSKATKISNGLGRRSNGQYCQWTTNYQYKNSNLPKASGGQYSSYNRNPYVKNTDYRETNFGQVQTRNGVNRWQDTGKRKPGQNSGGAVFALCSPNAKKTACDKNKRAWGYQNGKSCRLPSKDNQCK